MVDTSQVSTISTTDVAEFIQDLDGGVFEKQLSAALSQVAGAVVEKGKKGSVVLTFSLERISDSASVIVEHQLKFTKPTMSGEATEKSKRSTPMHVGRAGKLTIAPETQLTMFDRQGQINQTTKEKNNG